MANTSSAKKAIRSSARKYARNQARRSAIKQSVKAFKTAVESKDQDKAKELLTTVYKKIDKGAKTRIISKNKAARHKSQFAKALNNMQA